jgi:hypothetical protein
MGQQPPGPSTIIGVPEMERQDTRWYSLELDVGPLGKGCGMKYPRAIPILFTGVPRSRCDAFDQAEAAPSGPGEGDTFDALVLEEERCLGATATLPRSLSTPDAIIDREGGGVAESSIAGATVTPPVVVPTKKGC